MIDMAAVGAIASSITTAKSIASALMGLRDANLQAESLSRLNEQLLKAQEGLLAHNTGLLNLQQEHFELTKRLRELEEAINQRGRYSLVNVGNRQFAYRVNTIPSEGGTGQPVSAEPEHYLCQSCFDKGRKVVLQGGELWGSQLLICPDCKTELNIGSSTS